MFATFGMEAITRPLPVPEPRDQSAATLHYNKLREGLLSGAIEPTFRAIAKYARCSHEKARELVNELVYEEVLQLTEGNRLKLASG